MLFIAAFDEDRFRNLRQHVTIGAASSCMRCVLNNADSYRP